MNKSERMFLIVICILIFLILLFRSERQNKINVNENKYCNNSNVSQDIVIDTSTAIDYIDSCTAQKSIDSIDIEESKKHNFTYDNNYNSEIIQPEVVNDWNTELRNSQPIYSSREVEQIGQKNSTLNHHSIENVIPYNIDLPITHIDYQTLSDKNFIPYNSNTTTPVNSNISNSNALPSINPYSNSSNS